MSRFDLSMEGTPDLDSDAALRFCKEHLGPVALSIVENEAGRAAILHRLRDGLPLHDAILAELFRRARHDRTAAGEFLDHFEKEFAALRGHWISPALRRQLDTDDVLASVVGDLWKNILDLEYVNRMSFLSLIRRRFDWKVRNKLDADNAQKRREDLRVFPAHEQESVAAATEGPATQAARNDERQHALDLVDRLSPRDRSLVLSLFRHETLQEIAAAHGLTVGAATAALRRAIKQLQALVRQHGGRSGSAPPP